MPNQPDRQDLRPPDWSIGAGKLAAFAHGLLAAARIPGLILFASAAGFGALARDAGVSLGNAVLMMGAFYALPAQVVLTDQLARGASLMAGALAVTLTGIRLLPMTVTLVPHFKSKGAPRWALLLAAHCIAITAWIEGFRRLPQLPEQLRLPHFLGLGAGLVGCALTGAAVGHEIAGSLPALLSAVLLFLTPIYFMLSLIATGATAGDRLAVIAGGVLGPLLYLGLPGFDLLATGLIGGTFAHFCGRWWRQ